MKSRRWICGLLAAAVTGAWGALPASAKTVVGDILPGPDKEWSIESTMTPVKVEDGWKLKSSATQAGGNAVNYFDHTYHKGQMIAYDFTVDGDEVTINIGFIRGLEENEYPNGQQEFLFSKYLAEALGIEATGEANATIPGGTYKGVLDPGDFFYEGFNRFQHIAVYLGGESITIREFAFVEGAEAGAETYPTKKDTTAPTTAPTKAPESSQAGSSESGGTGSGVNSAQGSPSVAAPKDDAGLSTGVIVAIAAGAVVAVAAVVAIVVIATKKKKSGKG